jgi:penicillin-binding protein 1B
MVIKITTARRPRRRRSREVRKPLARTCRRTLLLRACLIGTLVVCVSIVSTLIHCYQAAAQLVDARLANGYLTSRAGIYAAPRVLRAGQGFSRERLLDNLRRAGYAENAASNVWNGAFAQTDDGLQIWPRRGSNDTPEVVEVSFDRHGRISEITGDGAPLDEFALEPETLTNDAGVKTGRRAPLTFTAIPPVLTNAILAIEDRRFFAHHGLDYIGLGRALLSWTGLNREDELQRQGGSTITQQLVKNTYLTPERTLARKFNEALIATALERRLSKQDIFALYCNEIYLGTRGAVAMHGVAQAARVYFGKDVADLTLAEAATIAGMIQSPARYAPDRHPEQTQARRNVVLAAMLRDGAITSAQAQAASAEPVAFVPLANDANAVAPYFVDYVNRLVDVQLQTRPPTDARSLRIYTTLDLDLQQSAEAALRHQLERLEKIYKGKATPQAALVALDPQTGHVLALVGGSNYALSQLNRATDARRQPGSVFKPFVYSAALESGISPATMILDAPRDFAYDERAVYRPANYGGAYSMRDVPMRTGLVHSLNVVTVDLALRTGLRRVATYAERFGLPKPEPYPALALGTTEATPLEIASAYTAFANNGARAEPAVITRAIDADGANLLNELAPTSRQVIRPSTAYMITDALADVIDEGTARAARGLERQTAVAGKTGTSRDGWFAGYTPNLVCVVWVGFDDNTQLGLTGAQAALPIWQEFVQQAVALRPELGGERFIRPDGITTVEIDTDTGLIATPDCPHHERIAVTPALVPTSECFMHRPPLALAALSDTTGSTSVPPSPQNIVVNAAARVAANTRPAHTLPDHAAAVVSFNAPTQVEFNEQGRARLANDVRVAREPQTLKPHE